MDKAEKRYRIAQIGTFDYKNYGDILFPDVLSTELNKYLDIDEIVLFSPIGGEKPFDGRAVLPIRLLEAEHQKKPFDAIVCGGGDIIRLDQQVVDNDSLYHMTGTAAELWVQPILVGMQYQIPVLLNAPGVPFHFNGKIKQIARQLLEAVDYVSVRDGASAAILQKDIGIQPVIVPDSVFLIEQTYGAQLLDSVYESLRDELKLPEHYYLFQLNAKESGLSAEDCQACLRQIEAWTDSSCVLMPIGYIHPDTEVLSALNDAFETPFAMIQRELSPLEMLSVIRRAACFLGTSMHGCLTAMIQGVPAVALNLANLTKINGMFDLAGLSACVVRSIRQVGPDMLRQRMSGEKRNAIVKESNAHMLEMAGRIKQGRKAERRFVDLAGTLMRTILNEYGGGDTFSKLYLSTDGAFSEHFCEVVPFDEQTCRIDIKLNIPEHVSQIRFDPVEGAGCVLKNLVVCCADTMLTDYRPVNGFMCGERIAFGSADPQILITLPQHHAPDISIRCSIRIVRDADVLAVLEAGEDESRIAAFSQQMKNGRPFWRKWF